MSSVADSSKKEQIGQASKDTSNVQRIKVPARNPHKRVARGNVEKSLARMKARELEAIGKRY